MISNRVLPARLDLSGGELHPKALGQIFTVLHLLGVTPTEFLVTSAPNCRSAKRQAFTFRNHSWTPGSRSDQFKTSQMPVPAADPVDADTSTDYTGPPARDMIASHSLTDEIISRHNDPCPILGPSELILLTSYVHAPVQRLDILQANDMLDVEGNRPGSRAHEAHGSLIGYALATEYFNEQDITKLKDWFDEGHADQRTAKTEKVIGKDRERKPI